MDCEFFRRYLGRRVSVNGYQEKIVGTLAKVDFDYIVLTNAQVKDRLESDGWFERIQEQEGGDMLGPTSAETVVSANHIFALTCLEDDIIDTPLEPQESKTQPTVKVAPEITAENHLVAEALAIEIGVGLISGRRPHSELSFAEELVTRIKHVRNHLAEELGILLPKVRIRDKTSLGEHEYQILIDDHLVGGGCLKPEKLFVIDPNQECECKDGERCVEPIEGHSAFWIEAEQRLAFEMKQMTVVEPLVVLTTHFADVARRCAADILTPEITRDLVDQARMQHPVTINELIPEFVTITELHTVLQQLLAEQVSIRSLATIVESLSRCRDETNDEARLRSVRRDLARSICAPLKNEEHRIAGLEFESEFAAFIAELEQYESGSQCLRTKKTLARFIEDHWRLAGKDGSPVLLFPPAYRRSVQAILAPYFKAATFLSFDEIDEPLSLDVLDVLQLTDYKLQRENLDDDSSLRSAQRSRPR